MIPWLFIIICFFVICYQVRLSYLKRNDMRAKLNEQYIRADREANFARANPLEPEMYIRLSEKDFPFRYYYNKDIDDENSIIKIQNKVKLNLGVPIIRTGIDSNIEIKQRFGAANLPLVIDGEENFTKLLQHLNTWAKRLIKIDNMKDAELILEKAAAVGSDVSETYVLLFEIYDKTKRETKKDELLSMLDGLPETTRNRALAGIRDAHRLHG